MDIRHGLRHICAQCGKNSTYHKIAARRAFVCSQCGFHIYPCAGTILHDSHTSLQTWLYAIYLFVLTRHGVSGKEMQRALGVTYKTAWRIGHQIRILMEKADGFEVLKGHVDAHSTDAEHRFHGIVK
jgi:transposase